jgi:hypothetical protein
MQVPAIPSHPRLAMRTSADFAVGPRANEIAVIDHDEKKKWP